MKMLTKFADHEISLDEATYRFKVTGFLFPADRHNGFRSMDEAKEEIEKRVKINVKSAASNLGLPVIKHDGSGTTEIKGMHARLGSLLFTDGAYSKAAAESYSGVHSVYPAVDWIAAVLREREQLQARIVELNKLVKPFAIDTSYTYASHIRDVEGYTAALDELKKEYAEKLHRAQTTNVTRIDDDRQTA